MGEAAALNCMEIYIACLHVGQMQIINIYGTVLQNVERFFSCYILLNCFFLVRILWVLTSQCGNSQPGGTGLPLFQLQQAVQSTQIYTMHGGMTSNRSKKSEESAFLHRWSLLLKGFQLHRWVKNQGILYYFMWRDRVMRWRPLKLNEYRGTWFTCAKRFQILSLPF